MASANLARVSGHVLSIPTPRTGFFRQGHPRAGEEWMIETANVLVADQNVTAVTLPRRDKFGNFEGMTSRVEKGSIVDLLVEFTVYNGDIQVRVLGDFPLDSLLTPEQRLELATAS